MTDENTTETAAPKARRKRAKRPAHRKTAMDPQYGPPVLTSIRLPGGLIAALKVLARRRASSVNGEIYAAVLNRLAEEEAMP